MRAEILAPKMIPTVNRFYKRHNSSHRAGRHETVAVIKANTAQQPIIGAVRLKRVGKEQLLTGLFVDPLWRKQGIARQLITTLANSHFQQAAQQKRPIYAFVEPPLLPLYTKTEFIPSEPEQLPTLLHRNLTAFNAKGRCLIALTRHS